MSLTSRRIKLTYLLYATLALLVVGAMTWATVASLRLERSEQRNAVQREHDQRIRLAMAQMENWVNQLLSTEISREYWHFLPYYRPNSSDVRLQTGEMLSPGMIVQVSPLLKNPPRWSWLTLHFQASPHTGFQSPQLAPDHIRDWPAFDAEFDTWNREPFARRLEALASRYTADQLAEMYMRSQGGPSESTDPSRPASAVAQRRRSRPGQTVRAQAQGFARRKQASDQFQRGQLPQTECAPHQLAVANFYAADRVDTAPDSNEPSAYENEIGIICHHMRPIWLQLSDEGGYDLCFLRAVDFDFETAWQGFIINWDAFSTELLAQAADLFPDASLVRLDTDQPWPTDDSVFSLIPAQLVPTMGPQVLVSLGWSTTHTLLAVGWAGALFTLAALATVIRSVIRLSERRTQFAYAVTHELRTPLTTFRLYTDMLAQGLVSEENRQGYLETLNSESQRLADLVTGVLEYSRIENHSVPVNRSPTTVGKLLEAIRITCQPRCQNARMNLKIDSGGLDNEPILTDQQLAVQIVGNLVDNACKYGRDPDDPTVTVTAREDDGQIHIDVADRGPGIPLSSRRRIFRPYNRAAGDAATVTGGIGLGLALSRSWARLLGGQLVLASSSRSHRGARFCFTFPRN